jgi:FkbM family methyltransferase
MNVDRRTFLPWLGGGISSRFLTGLLGGLGVGSSGTAVAFLASRPPSSARRSYAQQGEDLIVDSILRHLGLLRPSYLDVGACTPVHQSNTYLFYEQGCRGVLVEPNPSRRSALVAERPRDTTLSVGVGSRGTMDFYVIGFAGGSELDTFDRQQAEGYARRLGPRAAIHHVIKVPLVPINEIVETYFQGAPDFLSIDTEGMDLEILRSLDFERFRPAVVCAETLVFGTNRVETRILDLMAERGYTVRGGTHVNTIFVDDRRMA